ncbi:ankyrin repeat-containing domain protein [Camillea tinctor]|nr:ankyrin repeat-containing domain protein [Camillea tinctor]
MDSHGEKYSKPVNNAIVQYVKDQVAKLASAKEYPPHLRDSVERGLSEMADGTFLWVSLACKELGTDKVMASNTLRVLKELPRGLVPLYKQILHQVLDNQNSREMVDSTVRVLQTVLVASRPLTIKELVLAADLRGEQGNERYVKDCVELCGSFLNFNEVKGSVSLIHQSIREYLGPVRCSSPGACASTKMYCRDPKKCGCSKKCYTPDDYPCTEYFPIEQDRIHTQLAKRCIEYLATEVYSKSSDPTEPFARYASDNWVVHARNASSDLRSTLKGIKALDTFLTRWASKFDGPKIYEETVDSTPFPQAKASSLLRIASCTGITQLVDVILERMSGVNEVDGDGYTALHFAAGYGYQAVAKLLLDRGADPDGPVPTKTYPQQPTPLQFAVKNNHYEVAQLLLERGADPNILGPSGETALSDAVRSRGVAYVVLLLDYGADPNVELDPIGYTNPLSETSPVEYAIEMNRSWNTRVAFQQSLDSIMAMDNLWNWLPWGDVELATVLLEGGADPNARDTTSGICVLALKSFHGDQDVVRVLLEYGADPEIKDILENTALHYATNWSLAEMLLDKGAEIDAVNMRKTTALHFATKSFDAELIRGLLGRGANPWLRDSDGMTASDWFEQTVAEIKGLLSKGAVIDAVDTDNTTALHFAAAFLDANSIKGPVVREAKKSYSEIIQRPGVGLFEKAVAEIKRKWEYDEDKFIMEVGHQIEEIREHFRFYMNGD